MKKSILFSISLSLFSLVSMAQANLQFNQIIRVTNVTTVGYKVTKTDITSITVPANKVWKIESGSIVMTGGPSTVGNLNLLVDKQVIFQKNFDTRGAANASYTPFQSGIIWLGSGTYTVSMIGYINESYGTCELTSAISAIEYNLVP